MVFCESVDESWKDSDNWWSNENCTGSQQVPGTNDLAVILANKTADFDQIDTIGGLEVRSGAVVNVLNQSMTINGNFTTTQTIDGTMYLTTSSSQINVFTNDQVWDGGGTVIGQNSDSEIFLGGGIDLVSFITIESVLKIDDSVNFTATFKNSGVVDANASGVLLVDLNSLVNNGDGEWRVSASGATLRIDLQGGSAGTLTDDFTVQSGELELHDPGFESSGVLIFTGGTIDCSNLTGSNVVELTGT